MYNVDPLPSYTPQLWREIYDLLAAKEGCRRQDITDLILKQNPGMKKKVAERQAGSALTTLHNQGMVFRNGWYYALTELGHKQHALFKEE